MSTPQHAASQQDRPLRVFLCHSSSDKPVVRELYKRLKRDGFQPWLDEQDLIPGQVWQEEIPAVVRSCDVVIVCISKGSISKEGYVQKEIRFALDVAEEKPLGTIFFIPVRLEDVQVPDRLHKWHWANYFQSEGHSREDGYQHLLRALEIRGQAVGVTRHSSPPTTPLDTATEQRRDETPSLTPDAMCELAIQYLEGDGVEQDCERARELLEKAAGASQTDAMFGLGALWEEGEGVAKDYVQARQWYEKAAAKEQADAMNRLGVLYHEGKGVNQDDQQARQWYEKAAAKEQADAMNLLGLLYYEGKGVSQDYQRARQWYEKAAGGGHANAMNNLGVLYHNGKGVKQDYQKARDWYERALASGSTKATENLKRLKRSDSVWGRLFG